jgi:hypothetical protein
MVGGCIDQQAVFKVGVGLRGSGLMEHAGGVWRRVVHCSMGVGAAQDGIEPTL